MCETCQAIGQCVSVINCDISQRAVPGSQPVGVAAAGPHSLTAFEPPLCPAANEGMFFSAPLSARAHVRVCMRARVYICVWRGES